MITNVTSGITAKYVKDIIGDLNLPEGISTIGAELSRIESKMVTLDTAQTITGQKIFKYSSGMTRLIIDSTVATVTPKGTLDFAVNGNVQKQIYLDGNNELCLNSSPTDSSPSTALITKANVMSTDGKLNNLVHTIGNETVGGQKRFAYSVYDNVSITTSSDAKWRCVAKMPQASASTEMVFFLSRWSSDDWIMISYLCRNHSTLALSAISRKGETWNNRMAVVSNGTNEYLWVAITSNWGMFPLGGNRNVPFEPVPTELVDVRYDTFEELQSAYTYSRMIT